MPDPRHELIEIFAKQKADKVADDPNYQALCARHEDDRAFHGERERIEQVKRFLERTAGIQGSYQDQVKWALKTFERFSKERDQETCRELVRRGYSGNWSKPQQQYFQSTCQILQQYHDYFLSFTNRNPTPGVENLVNSDYKHFIISVIGLTPYEDADRRTENLLARAIYHLLNSKQLKGFYYPIHEQDNQEVEQKLTQSLTKAIVFLQMVQNQMFVRRDSAKNYCFLEYNVAARTIDQANLLFVLTAPSYNQLIPDHRVDFDFDDWYHAVKDRDPVTLGYARHAEPKDIDAVRDQVEKKVVSRIEEAKQALFNRVPL